MESRDPVFTVEPPTTRAPGSKFPTSFNWIFISMFLTTWAFAQYVGWACAVGVIFLLLVHEMGHVAAAKLLGIPVSAPLFIPFFGAAIVMKENPRDAWTEALMAYGGPLAGGIGAWCCFLLGQEWHSPLLINIALISFGLNLFNLIPLPPLDGGRICAAVSRWFWLIGLALLIPVLLFQMRGMVSIVMLGFILFSAFQRVRDMWLTRRSDATRQYYRLTFGTRLFAGAFYLGLIAALLLGGWDAAAQLQTLEMSGEY